MQFELQMAEESGYSRYRHDDDAMFLRRTLTAMRNYQKDCRVAYKHRSLSAFSQEHRARLMDVGFADYLRRVSDCIESNQVLLNDILRVAEEQMDLDEDEEHVAKKSKMSTLTHDHLRVLELFRRIAREWSEEGAAERKQSFGLLVEELNSLHPDRSKRSSVRVLVPGCGLARLPFDLAASHGYHCIANEQSYLMLFAGNFILNNCDRSDKYRFYPWANSLVNCLNSSDVTTPVPFPDVDTASAVGDAEFRFEVVPGDFSDARRNMDGGPVDAVATSFFLDASHNPIDTVRTVAECLRPGGHWLNVGPLNYHVHDGRDGGGGEPAAAIPLSWETLRSAILDSGFALLKESVGVDCAYCQNPRSMGDASFKCVFFVCQKREEAK